MDSTRSSELTYLLCWGSFELISPLKDGCGGYAGNNLTRGFMGARIRAVILPPMRWLGSGWIHILVARVLIIMKP
ncbi:hypothetical protein BDV27DRAFT_137434 [Aspergillus caelatus]|uniref:Uncharacterized protein n=1 Tax=Aspergillus caelatus TaxID=61420 RepID=A0A5N6ZQZ4_9EURO|nr:uncharacterized protein BDV27DRAFT_137434 [Aspergillus caelatus]KAE8358600.1 hypothetical protein BDV27DRAFT_137434 [Aspergillus caelatus]